MTMLVFRYRAYDDLGRLQEGECEAASPEEASELLWARDLTPFEIKAAGARGPSGTGGFFTRSSGLSQREIAEFTREFATLEQADIAIDDALRILCEQTGHKAQAALTRVLLEEITGGASLSEALQRRDGVFSDEYIAIVQAGELGGDIGRALDELAELMERRLELQAKMRGALIYPAILVALAIVSVIIVISVLVPSVAPIFADSGREMPAGLRAIIWLEEHWREILAVLTAFLIAGALGARMIARSSALRLRVDRGKLKLPGVGGLLAKRDIGRFARTLGSLLRAGVPLLPAMSNARRVVRNSALALGLDQAIDALRDGASLTRALSETQNLPAIALRMIGVGEESAKLDMMLLRLAIMCETQTQRAIDRFMTALTPLLTILIAGMVGALIMSVMTAILSINELAVQ